MCSSRRHYQTCWVSSLYLEWFGCSEVLKFPCSYWEARPSLTLCATSRASDKCRETIQRVQNSLARVVAYTKRAERIRPVINTLHWLPIYYHLNYNVTTLSYKVWLTGNLAYLLPSVSGYAPTRHLWSYSLYLLNVPAVWTKMARRALSHAALSVWNDLLVDIRRS